MQIGVNREQACTDLVAALGVYVHRREEARLGGVCVNPPERVQAALVLHIKDLLLVKRLRRSTQKGEQDAKLATALQKQKRRRSKSGSVMSGSSPAGDGFACFATQNLLSSHRLPIRRAQSIK